MISSVVVDFVSNQARHNLKSITSLECIIETISTLEPVEVTQILGLNLTWLKIRNGFKVMSKILLSHYFLTSFTTKFFVLLDQVKLFEAVETDVYLLTEIN